jgi:hypothetical protein
MLAALAAVDERSEAAERDKATKAVFKRMILNSWKW